MDLAFVGVVLVIVVVVLVFVVMDNAGCVDCLSFVLYISWVYGWDEWLVSNAFADCCDVNDDWCNVTSAAGSVELSLTLLLLLLLLLPMLLWKW